MVRTAELSTVDPAAYAERGQGQECAAGEDGYTEAEGASGHDEGAIRVFEVELGQLDVADKVVVRSFRGAVPAGGASKSVSIAT